MFSKTKHYNIAINSLAVVLVASFFVPLKFNFTLLEKALLEFGHFAFFAFITIQFYPIFERFTSAKFNSKSDNVSLVIYLAGASSFGFAIEIIQLLFFERNASLVDCLRNIAGIAFGIIILKRYKFKKLRNFLLYGVLVFILSSYEVLQVAYLRMAVTMSFPTLNDTSSPAKKEMLWTGKFSITKEQSDFLITHISNPSRRNSGISLKEPYAKWKGYTMFKAEIWVKQKGSLAIRINDMLHESNNDYFDRYNDVIELSKGWNVISIELSDIKNAPLNRTMNMEDIYRIGFFTTTPHNVEQFKVGKIWLTKG